MSKITKLSDIMSDCPVAAEYIRSHMEPALRQARFWQKAYPHADIEPVVMQALYLAAFTFKPGDGGFYFWFRHKLRGQLTNIRRAVKRRKCRIYGGLETRALSEFYSYENTSG